MWSGLQTDVRSRIEAGRLLLHDLLLPAPPRTTPPPQRSTASCTHALFERQVARTPDATAVVHHGRTLSYRVLNARANQIAHYLRGRGVTPDSLVAVCLERQPELIAALLGIWKAGAAYIPLDPAYPAERLQFMVADSEARWLITDDPCSERLTVPADVRISLDADAAALYRASRDNPVHVNRPSHLAYVIYTSGSTGKPKGVMVEHRQLVNYVSWAIDVYGVTAGGSVPVHSSMAFDLTVTSVFPPLLTGASIELLPEERGAQHLVDALRAVKGRALVKITPAHLELLSRQLEPDAVAGMAHVFVIGGENLPAETLRFWRQWAPATRLINEYGPTEATVGCCIHEVTTADPDSGPVPIGRPIANTELHVLDSEGQPVPAGVTGELYIGGAGVARGYLNRAALTAERFVDDPFSGRPDARLYRTGDLVRRREDGVLEFLGRADSQVKIRGYRVELGEVEATLAGHPCVQTCAVIAREDRPGERELVAYVVVRRGREPEPGDLRGFLVERLPEFMVPTHVCVLDTLPLTANGKVDRRALPAPSRGGAPLDRSVLPRTTTEGLVLRLFHRVLGRNDVGILDNFFEAGGQSLSAARLMSELGKATGINVPLRSLFEHPTPMGLAALVEGMVTIQPAEATAVSIEWQAVDL